MKCVKCNRREVKTEGEICPTCFLKAMREAHRREFDQMQDSHERIREKIVVRGVSER